MKRIVIVGAGPAGLVAGLELIRSGCNVLIVEKAPRIGGLHQSFHYGPFTFDVGAHCFDTTDQEATQYVLEILGSDYRVLPYRAAHYVCGKYLRDPLSNPDQLMRLPLPLLVKGFRDFAFRREPLVTDSLEHLALAIYGESFYHVLIKAPVEKTLRHPCAQLHPDQVHLLDVNMADQPFTWSELMAKATGKLRRKLRERLGRKEQRENGRMGEWENGRMGEWENGRPVPHSPIPPFAHSPTLPLPPLPLSHNGRARGRGYTDQLYPASGGFEVFVLKLAEKFQQYGGRILTGAGITQVRRLRDRIVSVCIDGHEYETDWLVWSGPLKMVMQLCGLEYGGIPPSSMIFYNLEVKGEPLTEYLWVQCWDPSVLMSRVSLPCLFRAENAPPGYYGLCAEVPCRLGDELWKAPEQFVERVQQDLITMGLVASREDFQACHIERLPAAFPILSRDYPVKLSQAKEALSTVAQNLVLIGSAAGQVGRMQNDQITYARRAAHGIVAERAAAVCV